MLHALVGASLLAIQQQGHYTHTCTHIQMYMNMYMYMRYMYAACKSFHVHCTFIVFVGANFCEMLEVAVRIMVLKFVARRMMRVRIIIHNYYEL